MPESQPPDRKPLVCAALLRPRVIVCAFACLLIGEEWQRSYYYSTGYFATWTNGSQLSIGAGVGEIMVRAWRMGDGFTLSGMETWKVGSSRFRSSPDSGRPVRAFPLRGPKPAWFHWNSSGPMPDRAAGFIHDTIVIIPCWPLFWLSLICTAWTLSRSYVGLARQREDRCKKCGYDLTGNVSGVCPECGTGRSGCQT